MDRNEVKNYWNKNAEAWSQLSREGYDIYRDKINMPAFIAMLPDIRNLKGLDIGCGEGSNTQLLAQAGAIMTGIDISDVFINYAKQRIHKSLEMSFRQGSAQELPFNDTTFDFCVSTMAFMDFPDQKTAIKEASRVLKDNGFFQFSISHPIFSTPKWKWVYENDEKAGIVVGDYFQNLTGEIEEWIFTDAPEESKKKYGNFKIPRFTKTLSEWINLLIDSGFSIRGLCEPKPSDEVIAQYPQLKDASLVPYFLIIQCLKQANLHCQDKLATHIPLEK